ncbi:MAG TPA: hypothetical protein VEW65_00335 [Chryseolinea sp.]|nr:hypothetical protein [Chryseolinea sp.]
MKKKFDVSFLKIISNRIACLSEYNRYVFFFALKLLTAETMFLGSSQYFL